MLVLFIRVSQLSCRVLGQGVAVFGGAALLVAYGNAVHMYPICSSAALLRQSGSSLASGVFGAHQFSSNAATRLPVVPY